MAEKRSRRQRRVVLPEEEYQSTLESVIQREYYPSLPELTKQVAVIDRREEGDYRGAILVRRAARQISEHEQVLSEVEQQEQTS